VMDPEADAAKKERIALLRKMVSSKGPGTSVSTRRSASVDRIPKSPRATTSPPDSRRSIFESGAAHNKKEQKEEQFPFKPTINAHSKEILAAKGEASGTPVYDKLYQKKNDKERRRRRAQEEQLTKEMADCTFQPNVNEVKRKMGGSRGSRDMYDDPNTSIVQRAESWVKRRDAELKSKREEKARREREVCTFKPGIHGVDKGLLRSQPQNSPGYEEFVQRQINARQARNDLSKVPHTTGEGWTGRATKAVGFSFHSQQDRKEIRTQIKSLKKPTTASGDAERGENEDDDEYLQQSESPGAVSSPEDEGKADYKDGNYIPLHEIVAMQWYYVDKSKQQQGPMSVSALSKHWKDSLVHENSYVWTQGMGEWIKAKDMPDLLLVLTHS